jgi:hypothetical protein
MKFEQLLFLVNKLIAVFTPHLILINKYIVVQTRHINKLSQITNQTVISRSHDHKNNIKLSERRQLNIINTMNNCKVLRNNVSFVAINKKLFLVK